MSGSAHSSVRPALGELPALPLHQRPKPVTMKTSSTDIAIEKASRPLTPPHTPPKPKNVRVPVSTDRLDTQRPICFNPGEDLSLQESDIVPYHEVGEAIGGQEPVVKLYSKDYRLHEELGHGAWSSVFRATEVLQPTTSDNFLLSPPTSPTNRPPPCGAKVLAVKKASRRDAQKILEKEARILTFLHLDNETSSYLVPFHGIDRTKQSIVLDAVPLTLESHVQSSKKSPFSTRTMFDPIIGAEHWANLAISLISGLAFLHSKRCIHGDIKPANVLLRPDESGKLTPLYCDFSSSRIITSAALEEVEEVSAVTADYTSPELLESLRERSETRAVVTFASDTFALAVTLLYAAIGESPYACARMDLQKLGMAKEGTPSDYARRGEQASRIMPGRAVQRTLEWSLMKDPGRRPNADEWKAKMVKISEGWRNRGWSKGG